MEIASNIISFNKYKNFKRNVEIKLYVIAMNIAKSNKIIPFIESLYISLENQVLSMKLSTIITNILKVKNISVEYLTDALKIVLKYFYKP